MSVRRDLRRLEEQGRIRRTHGGAVLVAPSASPLASPRNRGLLEAGVSLVDQWDVLVVTPIKAAAVDLLAKRALQSNKPVIAEAISYPGAITTISIDDYAAGVDLGHWVGGRFIAHPEAFARVLVVSSAAPNCQARSRGFVDGLRDAIPERFEVTQLDGKDVRQRVRKPQQAPLGASGNQCDRGCQRRLALGALDAYRAAGLDDRQLLVVSFGLEGNATRDLLAARGPFQAAVAMFPELVGRASIDASICAFHKCALPERVVIPTVVLTPMTWIASTSGMTPANGGGLTLWQPGVCQRVALHWRCLTRAARPKPARVGLVEVFSSHEWYANVQAAMASRARDMGIRFEVIDASHDLDRSRSGWR